jgi:hypothetical protein
MAHPEFIDSAHWLIWPINSQSICIEEGSSDRDPRLARNRWQKLSFEWSSQVVNVLELELNNEWKAQILRGG